VLLAACGVWTFAALQGRSGFDDPHPSFGAHVRNAERADLDHARLSAEARAEIEAAAAQARAALDLQRLALESALLARRAAFDAAAAVIVRCDARLRTLSPMPEPDDLAALGAVIGEDERVSTQQRRARVDAAATIAAALEETSKRLDT
jgi:transcription elongation GreA/GreB family factor